MQQLRIQETLQVGGGAVAKYSRMETVAISTLSAATSAFALSAYTHGLVAAVTTTTAIGSAATMGAAAIPATMLWMVGKELYNNYYTKPSYAVEI